MSHPHVREAFSAHWGDLREIWGSNKGHSPYSLLHKKNFRSKVPNMPRIARIIAVGYPHHITQRGNNRATVFFDDEDRLTYMKLLGVYAQKHNLQIWAYCLMSNHIHLLVLPGNETSLARGVGLTNQVYTQYINRKMNQSGRIWQNRFFSCIVENDQYLWSVARYIECNPLKVGLAESAETFNGLALKHT